ncbi:MAG: ABC transporter substrate-binding protein [Pseudomonadota bacterium]
MQKTRFHFLLAALCLCFTSTQASAKEGVTADAVTFTQTADMSGSRSALARELNAGTSAYFNFINEQGGIHGRKLYLKTSDDGYVVKRSQELVAEHIRQDDSFAFVSLIGTANAEAVLPLITAAKIPLIAPLTGASQLREPFNRYIFHIRGSYAQEVEQMVDHAVAVGMSRVAVFYDDDAFGQDVAQAVEAALKKRNLKPVAVGKIERGSVDVSAALKTIEAANPQVVICGSFGKSLVEFVKGMKTTAVKPQFYTLSFFTAGSSIKQLGADARGIVVTQVVPSPKSVSTSLVREFLTLTEKYSPKEPATYISLEGFLTAKVIVEGLRRAGPALTREKFMTALEGFQNVDLGGLYLSYSPRDHVGLKKIEITVVDAGGKVLR